MKIIAIIVFYALLVFFAFLFATVIKRACDDFRNEIADDDRSLDDDSPDFL